MKIIKPGYEFITPSEFKPENIRSIYKRIELAGRTCYKSEDRITDDSASKFVAAMVRNGHEAMLEHADMTIKFIVDRGVSHELVRHRVASFAQESSRFCSYNKDKFGGEITFIQPCYFEEGTSVYNEWWDIMNCIEHTYMLMLEQGVPPEQARSVLPNSVKTEVVMTANMREWRHFLKLRAAGMFGRPHPQMLEVTIPLLKELKENMPELFSDIEPMELK